MKSPKNSLKEICGFIERFPWEKAVLLFTGRGNSLLLLRILETHFRESAEKLVLLNFKNFPFFNHESILVSQYRDRYEVKFLDIRKNLSKEFSGKAPGSFNKELFSKMLQKTMETFPDRIPVLAFDYEDTWNLWGATSVAKTFKAYRPFVSMRLKKRTLGVLMDYLGIVRKAESPPHFWLYIEDMVPEASLPNAYRMVGKLRNFLLKFECDALFRISFKKRRLFLESTPRSKEVLEKFFKKVRKRNLEVYLNVSDILGFSGDIPGFGGGPDGSY